MKTDGSGYKLREELEAVKGRNQTYWKYRYIYLTSAITDDPNGAICAECGGPNIFCDDCGWWYCYRGHGAVCRACYDRGVKQGKYYMGER